MPRDNAQKMAAGAAKLAEETKARKVEEAQEKAKEMAAPPPPPPPVAAAGGPKAAPAASGLSFPFFWGENATEEELKALKLEQEGAAAPKKKSS